MEYVKIPGTNLSPSRIGLGTWAIGGSTRAGGFSRIWTSAPGASFSAGSREATRSRIART